jgi:hypothetical protein
MPQEFSALFQLNISFLLILSISENAGDQETHNITSGCQVMVLWRVFVHSSHSRTEDQRVIPQNIHSLAVLFSSITSTFKKFVYHGQLNL